MELNSAFSVSRNCQSKPPGSTAKAHFSTFGNFFNEIPGTDKLSRDKKELMVEGIEPSAS